MGAVLKLGSNQTCPEIWVTRLENTTSGTNLLGVKNGGQSHKVSMILNRGFRVPLPRGSCPVGHFVMIDFLIALGEQKYEMCCTGKVISTSTLDGVFVAEIEFKRYDKKSWSELLEHLDHRQDRVNQIFTKVKGE